MHLSYDGRLNLPTFRDIGSLNLILQTVNLYLQSRGVRITTGTIVDATIIRETRIGLVNENFVIRKQLLADYRAGIGPKPFEFVRRPDEERGALGMHYTSVPNILKVLNPLFLDDLHTRLEEAGDNPRTLLNLRKRIAKIRVFDPACGSGNFLVIAYKEMLAIESEINKRRGEPDLRREIPLTSFRGIELRDFPAEIARLALVIAEYQCDVLYRGQKLALAEFLPLRAENWITCGNALRLDWLGIWPSTGTGVKLQVDDLFSTPLDQAQIDFENEGGETYICGNPPYKGSKWQDVEQKADLANAWNRHSHLSKTTDFVSGWIARYLDYADAVPGAIAAFVATNSLCQGQQASEIWPAVFSRGVEIQFAHQPFKWSNLASHNAGVTVIIIGLGKKSGCPRLLAFADGRTSDASAVWE